MKHMRPISSKPELGQSSLAIKAEFFLDFLELSLTKNLFNGEAGGTGGGTGGTGGIGGLGN